MSQKAVPALPELEETAQCYFERIEQIDRILAGPVRTLIEEAKREDGKGSGGPPDFPKWISRERTLDMHSSRVATSLCLVTLHRLNMFRRRFPALRTDFKDLGRVLEHLVGRYLPSRSDSGERYFRACCELLDSRVLGVLNPFTASQVFRVLMESGEDRAHSGTGCMAFFAMVWPLYRKNEDDPLDLGARIEPSRPNAYVTAKCLLPLIELRNLCTRRAALTRDIRKDLVDLKDAFGHTQQSSYAVWRFCASLETLAQHLAEMAPISIAAEAFWTAKNGVDEELTKLSGRKALDGVYESVLAHVCKALQEVEHKNLELLADARVVLKELQTHVVSPLLEGHVPEIAGRNFGFFMEYEDRPPGYSGYVEMLGKAAQQAAELCDKILAVVQRASKLELGPQPSPVESRHDALLAALDVLAGVNDEVAREVARPVDLQARWCHTIANREIAFTSADNFTDFDPAELVSSIAVAVRTHRLTTPLQLADATGKAVLGAQRDGSWRLMHAYFSADGTQTIRPPAADVVWTLASSLSHFPEISVADDTLFRFVDWLERTQREVRYLKTDAEDTRDDGADGAVGWSADQMREDDRISLLTTAYAVNALLAVRDLVEHRLWELCVTRFTVVKNTLPLSAMDPVDLLEPHAHRLHSRLSRMARDTDAAAKDATYSIVLHGPPGSSKTMAAGALSHAMWRGSDRWKHAESRLVRITPADFTRLGEDRVDAEARLIFRLLSGIRGVTILFDEIDDLLRRRKGGDGRSPRFLDLVIPAMLNRLQDLRDVCERQEICFLFGTNYVERIEPALIRKGRIDDVVTVTYPDYQSRRSIAERILEPFDFEVLRHRGDETWEAEWVRARLAWCEHLACKTAAWPWNAVVGACKDLRDDLQARIAQLGERQRQVTPITPRQVFDDISSRAEPHLARNMPDVTLQGDYLGRFDHQESAELRDECLHGLAAYWTPDDGGDVHHFIETRVGELFGVSAKLAPVGGRLVERLKLLPHATVADWTHPPGPTRPGRHRKGDAPAAMAR
jgi:hypothetical protein